MRFLTVCLNPTVQRTLVVQSLEPGEVNRAASARVDSAGKGANVGRVIHQLGCDVVHLTQAGGPDGDLFLRLCAADGLDVIGVPTTSNARTCTTVVDETSRLTTEFVEPTEPVDPACESRVWDAYIAALSDAHSVVISGSKAPGFSATIFPGMVEAAKKQGVFVLVDYRGDDLIASMNHRPDVIKPNLAEFVSTFLADSVAGGRVTEDADERDLIDEVERAMLRIHRDAGSAVVLTRGKRDTLVAADGSLARVPVLPVTPVNTIGCGDAFAAGLAVALRDGAELLDAIDRAHECAAANAGLLRPGVIR